MPVCLSVAHMSEKTTWNTHHVSMVSLMYVCFGVSVDQQSELIICNIYQVYIDYSFISYSDSMIDYVFIMTFPRMYYSCIVIFLAYP